MTTDLDSLLDRITELEADTFSWADAARWSPGGTGDDRFYGDAVEFLDAGAVAVCDPARPWVVTSYAPPWWARG